MPSDRAWSTERIDHFLAVDEDRPRIRPHEAGEDLDQRRLAGAVVADQSQHLALGQVQRDVDERRHHPEALRDVLDADRVRLCRGVAHCSLPRLRSRATWTFAIIDSQDREADDQVEREGADADDVQAGTEDDQDRDADEAADHGADAAEERRAADHRPCDGEEHQVRAALERDDRRDAGRVEDPGEAGEDVREHEVADLDRPHVDAALGRADQVPAGREGPEPPAGPGEDRLHEENEAQAPRRTRS